MTGFHAAHSRDARGSVRESSLMTNWKNEKYQYDRDYLGFERRGNGPLDKLESLDIDQG